MKVHIDRIYVAGFGTFYPDRKGKRYFGYQELRRKYNFEMQAQKTVPNEGRTLGEKVFLKNIYYIDSSDYVVANLDPFRGREPDSGTCFEIGYTYALGKRIYGYLEDGRTAMERAGVGTDEQGFTVGDFDMPMNLMLGCSMTVTPEDLEHCLEQIRGWEQAERRV